MFFWQDRALGYEACFVLEVRLEQGCHGSCSAKSGCWLYYTGGQQRTGMAMAVMFRWMWWESSSVLVHIPMACFIFAVNPLQLIEA